MWLAHAYNAASSLLNKLGDRELAAVAADRAVRSAGNLDDPLLAAASAYRLANVFLPAGRTGEAKDIALAAAANLEPTMRGASAVATWGGLVITAAIASARRGDRAEAWELLGEAKTAARRLGRDHADLHTIFGPTSINTAAVEIAAELGDGLEAVRRSATVDTTAWPAYLVEHRTRFLVDVARGHALCRQDQEATAVILDAEKKAPEEVRYDHTVRELVLAMLGRERAGAAPELRGLARRIGLAA